MAFQGIGASRILEIRGEETHRRATSRSWTAVLLGQLPLFTLLILQCWAWMANKDYSDVYWESGRFDQFLALHRIELIQVAISAWILSLPFNLAPLVAMDEDWPVTAMLKAWKLTRGNRLKVLGLLLASNFVTIAAFCLVIPGYFAHEWNQRNVINLYDELRG